MKGVDEVLDLPEWKPEIPEKPANEETVVSDYDLTRQTLKLAIHRAAKTLDDLDTAFGSDPSPNMAMAMARLMEIMTSSAGQLLKASKDMLDICTKTAEKQPEVKAPIYNTAVIVGSVADALKLLGKVNPNEPGDPPSLPDTSS